MKKLILLITFTGVIYSSYGQWSYQVSNTTQFLYDVAFVDSNKGWAVGKNGTIIFTTDGGELWSPQNAGTSEDLESVCFPSESVGYIVGGNPSEDVFLKSTDGGLTWNNHTIGLDLGLIDCYFVSNDTGYIVTGGGINGNEILKTTDGGNNWINLYISDTATYAQSIHFVDANNGFAVGYGIPETIAYPMIIKTTDGGLTWSNQTPEIHNHVLHSVFMVDQNIVYAVGDTNTLSNPPGRVLKTTDGGLNWESYSLPGYLHCVLFTNENIGYAPGLWEVYNTSDGGFSWNQQTIDSIPPANRHNSICFPTIDTGFIVGWFGQILKTTNGGGTVGVGLLEIETLEGELQVFPNPAANLATIAFNLKKEENVSISICNNTGNELKQIQLGVKNQGKYQLDCINYPSGIYLITLKTETGILTEKLIIE